MLNVERPETARELVEACPLAVVEWALKGLTLTNDDATAEQCFVCYVFHGVCPPWAFVCLGLIALA